MTWKNPFPGIDPYIQGHGLWQGFHNALVAKIVEHLNALLPAHYGAVQDEAIQLVYPAGSPDRFRPDVAVTLAESMASRRPATVTQGVATLEPIHLELALDDPEEIRHAWIEIRGNDNSLVTWIELLSPSNKIGEGRREYLEMRAKLLDRPVHLVEIDLLIGAKSLPMCSPLPVGHCFVFVSRAEKRPVSDVYTWPIRDPIPAFPVPLRAPDRDVMLDLASAYQSVYEGGRYGWFLREREQLGLPLSDADRAWIMEQIKP